MGSSRANIPEARDNRSSGGYSAEDAAALDPIKVGLPEEGPEDPNEPVKTNLPEEGPEDPNEPVKTGLSGEGS